MTNRKPLPKDVELEVLFSSRRKCCLCFGLENNFDLKQGQIAHIDRDNTNHRIENLVFLCLEHHDRYDTKTSQSKGFTEGEIRRHREMLYAKIQKAFIPYERLDLALPEILKIKIWKYYPLAIHYLNLPRLLAVNASFNDTSPLIDSPVVNSIRQLDYANYHSVIAFAIRLLHNWHPKVLNPHNIKSFQQQNLGCAFEFSFAQFSTKNVKFWNQNQKKPKTFGVIEKDPHLYYMLGELKVYLPLDYSWITTDTAFNDFMPEGGHINGLSGLAILKYLSDDTAVMTPLVLGTFNPMQAMEEGANTFEMPYSWRQ